MHVKGLLDTYHSSVIQGRCQHETTSEVLRYKGRVECTVSERMAAMLAQRDSRYNQKTALFPSIVPVGTRSAGLLAFLPLGGAHVWVL